MPSDSVLKTVNCLHRATLKVSRGRLGNSFYGMPSLELVTIGRKSGRRHAVMLTAPIVDEDSYIVVASRYGDPTNPGWYWNLRADPQVWVAFQNGPQREMFAQVLSTEERAQLWPRVAAEYSTYANYQKKTSREIPLVRLKPR